MDSTTFSIFTILFLILSAFMWTAIASDDRGKRIRYGIVSILAAAFGFLFVGTAISFNYNAWYSSAADKLIEASVNAMESGRQDEVLREWKVMDGKFRWTYQRKGNFRRLAEDAIKGMNTSGPR